MTHLGGHAVVIGGSMAGLMTARVLADLFDQVTVLERDQIGDRPAIHKSIPQGNHIHALFLGGQQVLSLLYPNFTEKLESLGAVRLRGGKDMALLLADCKTYNFTGFTGSVREPRDLGFDFHSQSRGLLEHCVRQCTRAFQNITLRSECSVHGLIWQNQRIEGVRFTHHEDSDALAADLIVDAGGRCRFSIDC